MQRERNSLSIFSENLSLDRGSVSSDTGIDSQITWNTMQTSGPNGFSLSSDETSIQYLHHVRHDGQNTRWSLGETSSNAAQNLCNQNERTEHPWSFPSGASPALEEAQYEFSNILSSDNVEVDPNGYLTTNGSLFLNSSSSPVLPQDLNMSSGFGDHEDDDCQIVERPNTFKSVASSNEQIPMTNSSFDPYGAPSARDEYHLDGRRISCKRKALELDVGQSSGEGSSNSVQNAGRSPWRTVPAAQNASSDIGMPPQIRNELVFSNASASLQTDPRLRLGVEGSSASPFSLTASGNAGRSRRNLRLRVNGSHQRDVVAAPFSAEADGENRDISSHRDSAITAHYDPLADLNSVPAVENAGPHAQYISSVRINSQARWNGASASRTSRSSASAISREWDALPYEESSSRSIPRNVSEHPMFAPAVEIGSSSQNPGNLNEAGGPNGVVHNIPSTFGPPGSGVSPSAPSWPHRRLEFPRRLSEVVRRSLLSLEGTDSENQSSNHADRPSSSNVTREIHTPSIRLERNPDGSLRLPSLRAMAYPVEGRSSVMSEQIRHVLNLMRRGEGLRFEDVMALDHPLFFGMADIHDRHRDMRLDVDNMSYEELLALEERIGDVCTGLSEETIVARLKQHEANAKVGTEPCSICQEEYEDGEKLGKLDCGHDYHAACIKQWLMKKNVCPICKKTGLTK